MTSGPNIRDRRRVALDALAPNLDASNPNSAAARLKTMLDGEPRKMIISGDVDGILTAMMLRTVAPWSIVAVINKSDKILVHPDYTERPENLFGVDVFAPDVDCITNHIVLFGSKQKQKHPDTLAALHEWDDLVHKANKQRLLIAPALWASTEASRPGPESATAARFKYPLGTAQLLLALLDASSITPRFYDRHFLPWLIADADGGVASLSTYRENVSLWWGILSGAVGPATMTTRIYDLVAGMRADEFADVKNRLRLEFASRGEPPLLNDRWNLAPENAESVVRFAEWLSELALWDDPFEGGAQGILKNWIELSAKPGGIVPLSFTGDDATDKQNATVIRGAFSGALNANFRMGGTDGDRFNWHAGW